jgi:hypothetical protein
MGGGGGGVPVHWVSTVARPALTPQKIGQAKIFERDKKAGRSFDYIP